MAHLIITDSLGVPLEGVLENLAVESFPGARAADQRVTSFLENLRHRFQSITIFIGGNGLSNWGRRPAESPEQVKLMRRFMGLLFAKSN